MGQRAVPPGWVVHWVAAHDQRREEGPRDEVAPWEAMADCLASWAPGAAVAHTRPSGAATAWGRMLGRTWLMVYLGGCRAALEYRTSGAPAEGEGEAAAVFAFLRDRLEEFRVGRDLFEAARQAVGTALETYEGGLFDLFLISPSLLLAVVQRQEPALEERPGGCLLGPRGALSGRYLQRHPRFGARLLLLAEGDLIADAHV